jgi:hypothetical protein
MPRNFLLPNRPGFVTTSSFREPSPTPVSLTSRKVVRAPYRLSQSQSVSLPPRLFGKHIWAVPQRRSLLLEVTGVISSSSLPAHIAFGEYEPGSRLRFSSNHTYSCTPISVIHIRCFCSDPLSARLSQSPSSSTDNYHRGISELGELGRSRIASVAFVPGDILAHPES